MNNGDMPAHPTYELNGQNVLEDTSYGLTKREQFAMAAMQGLLANSAGVIQQNSMTGFYWCNTNPEGMAELAVTCANAVLAELNKPSGE